MGHTPRGAILGSVLIEDFVQVISPDADGWPSWIGRSRKTQTPVHLTDDGCGYLAPGSWAWIITPDSIHPIDPVPCRGRQGIWQCPPLPLEAA